MCFEDSTFQSDTNVLWSLYFAQLSGNNKVDKTNPTGKYCCPHLKF